MSINYGAVWQATILLYAMTITTHLQNINSEPVFILALTFTILWFTGYSYQLAHNIKRAWRRHTTERGKVKA